ncbi:MAG: methylenetetrahydrofolate reductase C-terminal domain-containing protein [Lentisphaeria bacterium]|nr:methylenetetrahydrofolate reductase C-terminal domain-containing protein [Lentisphaeria bacterium]
MGSNDFQLEMNFSERQNRFRKLVEDGTFSLLIEGPVPGPQMPPQEAVKELKALEEAVLGIDDLSCGLAILDRNGNQEAWSGIEFAAHLSEENRDRHVVYLSGRNRNMKEIDRQLAIAANAGNMNVVAVSGDLDDSPERSDSGKIFKRIAGAKGFFSGVTVNPYQYDPWALMAQYAKIAARLIEDAGFFVTQIGWDTLKLQSLSWFLLTRALYAPGFVRLLYLTPERMKNLVEMKTPGIIIGKELRETLEKELCYSRTQFEVAQLKRLKLQAAACKLMGFSGIQLCGTDHPQTAAAAAKVIAQGIREYKTFEEFLEVYRAEAAESEVNSFHLRFQLFDRVLKRPYPFDAPPAPTELPAPAISFSEKLALKFAPKDAFSSRRCGVPTVKMCPKHKSTGPCGGVRDDGRCENSKQECVYRKWFRFAAALDSLTGIEKELM